MPLFEIELENGHRYQVDADDEQSASQAVQQQDAGESQTTAGGAFARSAATGVVPAFGALGGAEAGAAIGTAIAPGPGTIVGGLIGGLGGSVLANLAQRKALQAAAPETAQRLAELEQADVQQHPIASLAGRLTSPAAAFRVAPVQAVRGLAAIPSALRGGASEEVKQLAKAGATQLGLAAGTSTVMPMLPESVGGAGRLPTLGEVTEGTAQMMIYGQPRFRITAPRLPLSEKEVQQTPTEKPPSKGISGLTVPPDIIMAPPSAGGVTPFDKIIVPRRFLPPETPLPASEGGTPIGRFIQQNRPTPPEVVVPGTPPEPQRGLTVLQEIRQANARTKEQIRQLYPQLSREQAAELRRLAWGEPPPEPEKPKPVPQVVPQIMEALQAGDLKAVKRLAKKIETESSDVPESVFGLEKGEEPDAIQERSTAPVPLEPAPGDSEALVQGVPPPGETAQAQAEAPAPASEVQPDVRVDIKKLSDDDLKLNYARWIKEFLAYGERGQVAPKDFGDIGSQLITEITTRGIDFNPDLDLEKRQRPQPNVRVELPAPPAEPAAPLPIKGTRIAAVASRLGDVVETGKIHYEAENKLRERLGISENDPRVEDIEHGFLDDQGNFLDKEEAYKVAESANQLKGKTEDPGFLGAEDLKKLPKKQPAAPDAEPPVKMTVKEFPDGFKLSGISVAPSVRGKGLGTKAMQDLIAQADEKQKPIYLTASAEAGKQEALNRFYERLGFEHYRDDPLSGKPMYRRMPKPTAAPATEKPAAKSLPPRISPPDLTGLSKEEGDKAFKEYLQSVDKYNADLKAWESEQPPNKPIIFKASHGSYTAITKDPQGGWRATTFSQLWKDRPDYAPWGHERYETRLKAVKEYASGELVDKLPDILTESEIKEINAQRQKENHPAAPPAEVAKPKKLNPQAQAMKERAASRPPDIIDYIANNIGKIKPKSAGKAGSEGYYDSDYDELSKSSAGRSILDAKGQSPDEAVDALRRAGILGPNATVNDMWMAMNRARAARRSYFKGETPEAREEKFWGAQKSLINQGKAQLVNVGDLAIGDKFTLKGEEMEIVAIDPDTGEVTVKNGKKFGAQTVPDGHEMPIDKGSLKKAPEEALPDLKPEAPALAASPTPKPKPVGELFGSKEMPFNLVGEKATTASSKPTGPQPELQQTEMFQIQKIVNIKDPVKSADAAQQLYGGPKEAASKLRHQLEVMDSDPKVKKTFGKEQRAMLKEVLALLDQRAAKEPLGPTQGAGPGTPSAAQGPDPGAPIEQLTDSFKTSKAPLDQRIKALVQGSYTLGEKLAQVKDAVARALSGLKTTGDALRKTILGFDSVDDMLKAKGELSAELEKRGWRVRAFVQTVKRAIPDVRRRNAIAKWVDAGGDAATLQQGLAATKPQYRQAYQDALNLKGDDLIHAQNIQNYFESRLQEAIDAGVLEHGIADYLHRIYPKDSAFKQRAMAYVQSGILSANPSLARKRVFHFDWEAEQAGYQPVQDFLPRIAEYETSLSRAIAARQFIAKLTQMKAPDGRPIIGIKGVGVPLEDPVTGERTGTVIKPLGDFKKASNPNDKVNYRGDYKDKEYPALSKWKWVAADSDGKPIFLKGDVAIHPAYAGRIEALLEPSHVRYGRYPRLGQALLGLSSTFKNTMLDLSGFHHVQIALHAMEHRVMPWQIMKDIPFENPHVEGLLRGGVTLGGEYRESHLGEGLIGGSLSRHIPVLGPIMDSYHGYLFQSLIPRIKMTMALHALDRNRVRFAKDLASGKMTDADLYRLTASQANAAFGEQNYIMLERSKTSQDLLRLIFLAPDFLEARGRFAGQAATIYGKEQRAALALGVVTMWTLARIINKALDDQYHLEPENLFNVIYKGNAYGLRTVQGDILHLIEKPVQFWMSRLNPLYGRTAMEVATGRDWFGRKRSVPEQAWDTVSNIVPIAVRSNRERSMWESTLNAFGVTARRYNDVDDAFKLAQKWKEKNGVQQRGEFIYDPDKDPLRSLKIALVRQDEAGAVKEIEKLLQSKATTMFKLNQYFQRYAAMPFSGSRANERKFINSLSEDERKTVESGRQTKQRILKLFRTARNQYVAAMQSGNR